ncbi:MAG: DDE-type integrase/transposase/recombinase [Chloroflexi bacterium]|nr:DDE-type integrase/transposase/recombinase [Chloroflexota bacterium]
MTTDKAKGYPSALRVVLPNAEHRSSHHLNNDLERDHQHLKGRTRPMRHFKRLTRANTFCQGCALIRNLARILRPDQRRLTPVAAGCGWAVLTADI